MTCVSKEYEIKTKMVQEQWLQLKMTFLLGSIDFWLVGELPHLPSRENPV